MSKEDIIRKFVKWCSLAAGLALLAAGAYGVVVVAADNAIHLAWIGLALVGVAGGEEILETIITAKFGGGAR